MRRKEKFRMATLLALSLSFSTFFAAPAKETRKIVTDYNGGNVITVMDSQGNQTETDDWFLIDGNEVVF